jgi:hypothetical protein
MELEDGQLTSNEHMAVNPDPKPGRWILPLVVLGMVAFTYFFVRELPEASPDTTLTGTEDTTTTTTTNDGTTGTTQPGGDDGNGTLDPESQTYIDGLEEINSELQVLSTNMVTVNAGFDADPREIEFAEAVDSLETIISDTQALEARLSELAVPAALEINHDFLTNAMDIAVSSAQEALSGLQSSDTGELRRSAAEAYTNAVNDFDTEVTNAQNAASGTDA